MTLVGAARGPGLTDRGLLLDQFGDCMTGYLHRGAGPRGRCKEVMDVEDSRSRSFGLAGFDHIDDLIPAVRRHDANNHPTGQLRSSLTVKDRPWRSAGHRRARRQRGPSAAKPRARVRMRALAFRSKGTSRRSPGNLSPGPACCEFSGAILPPNMPGVQFHPG